MNTPISFSIAKLLKEKEFDEKVKGRYCIKKITPFKVGIFYLSNYELHENFIYGPTIAEVVMWLYEKHGIWISVIDVSPSHILWEYQISKKEVGLIYSSSQYPVKHKYSPTEAYEAAIKHCLEKII